MSMMARIEAPAPPSGDAVRLGSEAYLRLFRRMLLDTHIPYRPAPIQWPTLDEQTRPRIVSLPVWDMAVVAEGRTGLHGRPFGKTVTDPLPRAAVETDAFEPVMREEGRHIVLFIDRVAWRRRTMPWWRRPLFEAKVIAIWCVLIWERIDMAKGMGESSKAQEDNFTLDGSSELGVEPGFPALARICLAENQRRLDRYDSRLLRPRLVPAMIRVAR